MSVSGDFGEPPAGINLSDDQSGQIIGAVTTLMVLSSVFIVVRLFTRFFQKAGGLAADDYLIVVGWVRIILSVCPKIIIDFSSDIYYWYSGMLSVIDTLRMWQASLGHHSRRP